MARRKTSERAWYARRSLTPYQPWDRVTRNQDMVYWWLAWLDAHDQLLPPLKEAASQFGRHVSDLYADIRYLENIGVVTILDLHRRGRRVWVHSIRGPRLTANSAAA